MTDEQLLALKKCKLFQNMSMNDMVTMLECFTPNICYYKNGEIIVAEGEIIDDVGIILWGNVINSHLATLLTPGDILDFISPTSDTKKSLCQCTANGDCSILFISAEHFHTDCACMCPCHRSFLINGLKLLSNTLYNTP